MKTPRWLTALVFVSLLAALYMNWFWPWGVLFLAWTIPSLYTRQTQLIGVVSRDEEPYLYWPVVILWIALSLLMILVDLAPSLVNDFYALLWGLI